ncbi:MAG: S-adenosylmethionine decarboxylase [Phascolarctobacterium sp.]|nr:S-adenosylmethionine decarboxylase [Phascolarctobacterium sp.]
MTTKKFTGKLIAIDMYNCSDNIIKDEAAAKEQLQQACNFFGLHPCDIITRKEEEQSEYSLFAICKQGHVTLHIYPNMGFATADVFSCMEGAEPENVAKFLRTYFDADKAKITLLDRGDFGTLSDMKPHRRSKVKFIRRTQNLGGKLKKIMMRPRSL